MTVFWIVVMLFAAGTMLIVLPVLLNPPPLPFDARQTNLAAHRDQLREAERDLAAGLVDPARYGDVRADIQRRVLEDSDSPVPQALARPDRRTAWALAVVIPLASVLTYLHLGDPQAAVPAPAHAAARHDTSPEQLQRLIAGLAERMQSDPENAQGWLTLGRSYVGLGRYRDAATAYRRAVALLPPDPALLSDLADLTAMAQGKRLAGEPAKLIQQALDLDPRHIKALALAGSVAFETKDYAAARAYWERLVAVVPPDSDMARSVRGSIAEAMQLGGAGVPPQAHAGSAATVASADGPPGAQPQHPASGGTITGRVSLSPALAARVAPGDTLFVFARAAEGPRMPLAILRRSAADLPLEFKLDDSMAMQPGLRLSAFPKVVIGARVSRSGNATPQPGDLVGMSLPVTPGSSGVSLVIGDEQR
jgi:cytochrome c-type biogenesis protein CcmH